ncbi:MAG TPA: UDP-N-acetylmuramoyl-L-alanyl-D-glutamate--2,6-diaminopimelate ligase [Pontiella sp.]
MKLNTLLESIAVLEISKGDNPSIEGITHDSRKVQDGFLFVAVSGYRLDGLDFISDALAKGAVAVVSEAHINLGSGVVHVQVEDSRLALAELSNAYYGNLSKLLNVVGVTGTNGKTTITYMIRDILRGGGFCPGLLGTVVYEFGNHSVPASRTTPEATEIHEMFQQMKEVGCDSVAMEVSSHAIALKRVHGIDFRVTVFTNLTQDHLDYHNDMESYFDVKSELFQPPENELDHAAVINLDDSWGRRLVHERHLPQRVVTYGFSEEAAVRAVDARIKEDVTCFDVFTPWGNAHICLGLLGRFNIHNALAALAVGGIFGIQLETMVKTLETISAVPGRLELVKNRKGRKIFVDYAHTDDALKNVLSTLREICRGKLLVVFGCGGGRDRGKRQKMGLVASELADFSYVTSDNPRNEDPSVIVSEIVEGFLCQEQYEIVLDRREAIKKAIRNMGRKDVLLIAGKGHEAYQEIKGAVVPFDDREIVREILG